MVDYSKYCFTLKDWFVYIGKMLIKGFVVGYLFYDSFRAILLFIPFYLMEFKKSRRKLLEKQKLELTLQFRSMIEGLAGALNAGYSMEHAFSVVKEDLQLLYDQRSYIFRELDGIIAGVNMRIPVEELLKDFGDRSGIDDIQNFANVVIAAKKSGGNLIHIIQKTVRSISDKLAVESEITTLIASKKLEQKIMMVMPYAMIAYLRTSNGSFLDCLYHNGLGITCMTVFLILIYLADFWAEKIMEIQV